MAVIRARCEGLSREQISQMVVAGVPVMEGMDYEQRRSDMQGVPRTREQLLTMGVGVAMASQAILADARPDVVLVWNGGGPPLSRFMSALSEKAGASVFYLERGLLPDSLVVDPEGVNARSYLCGPNRPALGLIADAGEAAAVRQYMASLAAGRRNVVAQPAAKRAGELRQQLRLPASGRVLMVPAQIDWDTNILYNSPFFAGNADLLRALVEVVPDDVSIVFKPHPEDPTSVDCGGLLGDRGTVAHGVDLHSLAELSDVVVVRNSTVGLEAVAHRKPVVVAARAIYSGRGFTYDLNDAADLGRVVGTALEEGFSAPMGAAAESFYHHLMKDYLYFLKDSRPLPTSNRAVLERLRAAAPVDQPQHGAGGPLAPKLREAEALTAASCRRMEAVGAKLRDVRLGTGGGILVVKACDRNRFASAVRAIAGSTVERGCDVIAWQYDEVEGLTRLRGIRRVYRSVTGVCLALARAGLGGYRLVCIICNETRRLSTKADWLCRILGRDRTVVADAHTVVGALGKISW